MSRNESPRATDGTTERTSNATDRSDRHAPIAEEFRRVLAEIGDDAREAPAAYARETRVPAGGE